MPSRGDWRAIDPDSLPADWPRYAPLIRRALMAGEGSYNERDVLAQLLVGPWQLWAYGAPGEAPASICITDILQFPRQRKCLVRYIAGEWEHFEENLGQMETYARGQGCKVIEAYMRKGLTRKLPPDWTVRHVIMVKEL